MASIEYIKINTYIEDKKYVVYMKKSVYENDGWKPESKLPEGAIVTREVIL